MPKSFRVTIPITGRIVVEIEADDEEDAIEKAMDGEEFTIDDITDWEPKSIDECSAEEF